MQHLDNDMDDLFQKAAEHYPLQTGGGDWENIAGKLKIAKPVQSTLNNKKGNNYASKLSTLILLLFFLLLGGNVLQTHIAKPITDNFITSYLNKKSSTGNNQKPHEKAYEQQGHPDHFKQHQTILNSSGNNFIAHTFMDNGYNQQQVSVTPEENSILDKAAEVGTANGFTAIPVFGNIEMNNSIDKKNIPVVMVVNKTGVTLFDTITGSHKPSSTKKHFYTGVAGAIDFSEIASNNYSGAGVNGGLVAGVQLSKKVSLETGVFIGTKKYYSPAASFNMDKIKSAMPAGMVVQSIEGKSTLIEIPVKVKYDLGKTNNGFFITSGLSAYIMVTEKNKYNVTMNGANEKMYGTYKKTDYGLPAVVTFSAGYQHSISKNVNIRVEPFLKIPLQGMGVGNLSITSAGLQLGIIHHLK